MQSGELIVTGKDKVTIVLRKFPSQVVVDFKDNYTITPCNPHHHDSLEYEVHHTNKHHSGFVLVIKWHVTGVREIKWTAYY